MHLAGSEASCKQNTETCAWVVLCICEDFNLSAYRGEMGRALTRHIRPSPLTLVLILGLHLKEHEQLVPNNSHIPLHPSALS